MDPSPGCGRGSSSSGEGLTKAAAPPRVTPPWTMMRKPEDVETGSWQPAGKPWAGRGRGRRHIFEKMLRAQRLFRAEVVPQWWPQERGGPSRLAPTPAQGAEPDLFCQKVKTVPPLPDATEPAARRPLTPRGSYLSGPPLLDTQRELAACRPLTPRASYCMLSHMRDDLSMTSPSWCRSACATTAVVPRRAPHGVSRGAAGSGERAAGSGQRERRGA